MFFLWNEMRELNWDFAILFSSWRRRLRTFLLLYIHCDSLTANKISSFLRRTHLVVDVVDFYFDTHDGMNKYLHNKLHESERSEKVSFLSWRKCVFYVRRLPITRIMRERISNKIVTAALFVDFLRRILTCLIGVCVCVINFETNSFKFLDALVIFDFNKKERNFTNSFQH
jgi:hypothetical protein